MREGCTLRAAVCSACCPLQLQLHSPEALSSGEKFDSPNPRREISLNFPWRECFGGELLSTPTPLARYLLQNSLVNRYLYLKKLSIHKAHT